ncbi:transposase domain-containing protein, partial [Escherichia coli]
DMLTSEQHRCSNEKNGVDPEAYLRHILSVLPEWPSNRVDELLPWNVVLTNK